MKNLVRIKKNVFWGSSKTTFVPAESFSGTTYLDTEEKGTLEVSHSEPLTVKEAALKAKVSESTVRRHINNYLHENAVN